MTEFVSFEKGMRMRSEVLSSFEKGMKGMRLRSEFVLFEKGMKRRRRSEYYYFD